MSSHEDRPTRTDAPRKSGPSRTSADTARGAARPDHRPPPPGFAARRLAVELIEVVTRARRPLQRLTDSDATSSSGPAGQPLEPRDRAFAHLIAMTVLRRHGTLSGVLERFIERPLPEAGARARTVLLAGAAQILLLGTPVHAAIDLAVEQCRRQRSALAYAKLVNAVLRRVAVDGPAILATLDTPRLDVPEWLYRRWSKHYGAARAHEIARASLVEAPLDISVKADPDRWAQTLGGRVLETGSVRLEDHGRVETLAGYEEGAWWVQDAAAALPVRLLGAVSGLRVADLCAAPGGKTAALAAAGAHITAVDVSAERLEIVRRNLTRLDLAARVDLVTADLQTWQPDAPFDLVLLDAPCSATGTIRRHPDILHLKRADDIARSAELQARLLARAATMLRPGGVLVYCTCSLEPEEGEQQVAKLLADLPEFTRDTLTPSDVGGKTDWLSPAGDLRTLPSHDPGSGTDSGIGGMDGFYAARLRRAH